MFRSMFCGIFRKKFTLSKEAWEFFFRLPLDIFYKENKMHKLLVIVDMQNDFLTGTLASTEAQKIVIPMREYIANFDGEVVFTKDTHTNDYASTQEGRNLPVMHCIKGTKGHDLESSLQKLAQQKHSRIFEKPAFGSMELAEYLKSLWDDGELESVTFAGVCTDICVISNALLVKATIPECPLRVLKDLCAGVSVQKHLNALDVMQSCQVEII